MNIFKKKFFVIGLVSIILLIGIFFISKETGLINTDATCRYTLTTYYNSTDTPTECSNGSWSQWEETGVDGQQKRVFNGVYVVRAYRYQKSETQTRRGLSNRLGCAGITDAVTTLYRSPAYGASLVFTTTTPFACSLEQTKVTVASTTNDDGNNEDGGNSGDDLSNEEIITTGEVISGDAGDTVTTTTQEISASISDMECSVDKSNWDTCDTVIRIGSWDDKVFVKYKTSNQCTSNDLRWTVNPGSNVGNYAYPMSVNTVNSNDDFGLNLIELQLTQKPTTEAYENVFLQNLKGEYLFPCSGIERKDLRIKVLNVQSSEI